MSKIKAMIGANIIICPKCGYTMLLHRPGPREDMKNPYMYCRFSECENYRKRFKPAKVFLKEIPLKKFYKQ